MKSVTMSVEGNTVTISLTKEKKAYRIRVVHSLFIDAYKSVVSYDEGAATDYYHATIGRFYEVGYR